MRLRAEVRAHWRRGLRAAKRGLPDRASLQLQHWLAHGVLADLRRPRTFSELIQARKLFERDARFALFADKVRVKALVAAELGPAWVIPTLWSGGRLPPRDQRTWPLPCVIKANHGCGWNLFLRSEADRDWDRIETVTEAWLSAVYKPYLRERFYADIPPQLLVEPFLGDPERLPTDYKFFCFGGRVEYVMVQSDRRSKLRIETFDREWRALPLRYSYDRPSIRPTKPKTFEIMRDAAEHLSRRFDFVRIDLYEEAGRPWFGEYSFTPGSGFESFEPPHFNDAFGALWLAARTRRAADPPRGAEPQAPGGDLMTGEPSWFK